jgi:hypothetical protein
MQDYFRHACALVAAVLLAACGGGDQSGLLGEAGSQPALKCALFPSACSSGAQLSGTFYDAPVSGLAYIATPSGTSGTTDSLGTFRFMDGDSVSFSALGVSLGAATPVPNVSGAVVVTPLTLTGESAGNAPRALAITRFLNSLDTVSVGEGGGVGGATVIPANPALATALSQLHVTAETLAPAVLQSVFNQVYGAAKYTVATDTESAAALDQAVTGGGFAGTVWHAECIGCKGEAAFYFSPDGRVYGFTKDATDISGTWVSSSGGIDFNVAVAGGGTASATLAPGASSGTLQYIGGGSSGDNNATLAMTRITAPGAPVYASTGLWFASFTPNAAGVQAGQRAGSAYLLLAPNGSIYGISGQRDWLNGSWDAATGTGSVVVGAGPGTVTFDLVAGTGTLTSGGIVQGTISLARTGTVAIVDEDVAAQLPFVGLNINVLVQWTNSPTRARSIVLVFEALDANGLQLGHSLLGEVNNMVRFDGSTVTSTGVLSLQYSQGLARTYRVLFGNGSTSMNGCTITNGAGAVVAGSGPGAYPRVQVKC